MTRQLFQDTLDSFNIKIAEAGKEKANAKTGVLKLRASIEIKRLDAERNSFREAVIQADQKELEEYNKSLTNGLGSYGRDW